MKLFFRLLWLVLTQRWRSRCSVLGPVDTQLRVYPNDLDALLHVNNGVYLTYADLGRTDLMLRSDAFAKIRNQGWYPVAAGASIEYKKSLKLGQVFTIRTHILGWDEKAIYLEQKFLRNDTLIAKAMIDARFLSRGGGRVSSDKLIKILDIDQASPEFPASLTHWIESRRPA